MRKTADSKDVLPLADPDFAVQTLLQFLKLLFVVALNSLQEPGRLSDCITSSNCDPRSYGIVHSLLRHLSQEYVHSFCENFA